MKKSLHSLNHLRAFESVGRHSHLQAAADELHVTYSAISRLITGLEEKLGVLLFSRKHKKMTLTVEGEVLFEACHHAFGILKNALHEVTHSNPNSLTVSCEPTIAMKWLIPRLAQFRQQHPELHIYISAAGGHVAFEEMRIDLAIRRNDFAIDKHYYPTFLTDEWIAPVAHASIKPQGLEQLSQLHTQTRPNAWEKWYSSASEKQTPLMFAHELWFEHFYLSLQAVNSKLGVGIASLYMITDELHNGSLVPLMPFVKDGTQYVLLSAEPIKPNTTQAIFKDWLVAEFDLDKKKLLPTHINHC